MPSLVSRDVLLYYIIVLGAVGVGKIFPNELFDVCVCTPRHDRLIA